MTAEEIHKIKPENKKILSNLDKSPERVNISGKLKLGGIYGISYFRFMHRLRNL